ncbi:carboxypeptidase-like regulatory domain-containing protein [uncultured Hymenobacter sp.]|uniref:carboxypeptidase-like regulatory domain-containing protein n=1 Tax=uncultured Hymenobacter sp. TaxID=170016 RepID=UPI0035CBBDF4
MGSITGIIRNTNHAPIENVNVLIVSGPAHTDIAAITGADGRFSFNSLRPGNYLLKAYGQVESDEIPVPVLANKTPFVEIWLETTIAK